ncbi:hypothetical protein IWX78_000840 [Mycetocola sp. CAN_C7]|uniref:hypothetical protein n=1 Tax=Mycetocola sp. CAN_C7 TaxID=2787724 RepID=UPI0018C97B7F
MSTGSRGDAPVRRGRAGDDGIRPLTRAVAVLVLPFLGVASVLLYLLPGDTERLFAWTIEPPLTAMVLGSAYIGGIWFFAQVLRQKRWHRVRHGFPAVLLFATLLGLATALHWDRFHPGHVSFVAWTALYATTPFLVLAVILVNGRADTGRRDLIETTIPVAVRILLVVVGGSSLAGGAILFFAPHVAVGSWAWDLTPLTARVTGAVLTLPGAVNLWMLVDGRWSAFRVLFQAQLISLIALNLTLLLCREQLVWANAVTLPVVVALAASLVAYAGVYLAGERRARRILKPRAT